MANPALTIDPIIAMTSYALSGKGKKAREAGWGGCNGTLSSC